MNTKAKIILRKKGATVLEKITDQGSQDRRIVPSEAIISEGEDGFVEIDSLDFDASMPFGLSWEYLISPIKITPEEISNSLHRNGIWTAEDYWNNSARVSSALLTLLQPVMIQMASIVKSEQGEKQ